MSHIKEESSRQESNMHVFILVMLALMAACVICGCIFTAFQKPDTGFAVIMGGGACYLGAVIAAFMAPKRASGKEQLVKAEI